MFDPRTQYDHRLAQNNKNCVNFSSDEETVQFRPNNHQESMENDDSGVCSPPLWKNSPSPSPSPLQPLLSHHSYKSLSPNSRAQAIARGQRELMEMVKNMPESSYELSLKDLVEHHKMEIIQPPQLEILNAINGKNQILQQRGVVKVKRQESKSSDKNMVRNGSFENKGLFLKMGFPFSFYSKKKNKFGSSNSSGKVSPKLDQMVKGGGGERDWWKKKFTGSSDSDSSRTSINSGSTESTAGGSSSGRSYSVAQRKKHGFLSGCWAFFQSRSNKSVE
ncbi:hypothetical protein DH2020_007886 [Rehmannia glutinosa]|uniref:Uncharacterized protein n=1 Tax=Rehmannia glutinosa TaxID=99300 RepID=A0ABR0U042_REHGL